MSFHAALPLCGKRKHHERHEHHHRSWHHKKREHCGGREWGESHCKGWEREGHSSRGR